jgi:putative MATE family efflux protein
MAKSKTKPKPRQAPVPFWKLVWQSVKGKEMDFTQGSIKRAVWLLAVPMILELGLESVFAVVDMFFVGRLGENAIATVGLTESVITIVYSLGIGLSVAATAIVARRVGEKNPQAAAAAGMQAILVAVLVSAVLSVLGVLFAGDILALMGASDEVVREGSMFTRITVGGNLAIILLFLINGIFRGAGDASMAMFSLWVASGVNIILCPILVHFMGLNGAAIATVIGRSTGVLFQCYFLFRGRGILKFSSRAFKPDFAIIGNIVKVASPAAVQFLIAGGSWMVISSLVARTDHTTASAGYQIAIRNVVFFILPAWGLSNAAAALVGQNLGAGKVDRAEKSVLLATRYNAIFMSFVMVLFLLCAGPIIHLFTDDEAVAAYGEKFLRIIGAGYTFYGIGMVMTQSLNGAGDTLTPTIINLVCFWLFQIPLALLLSMVLGFGSTGAVVAIPIAETVIAIVAYIFFKRGKWKLVKV